MLGLLSCALKRVIIELCQEKSSNHEKHGWNFYAKVVFLQPLLYSLRYRIGIDRIYHLSNAHPHRHISEYFNNASLIGKW